MILSGFNEQPVDKILTLPGATGAQGPPGLDLSDVASVDGGTASSTFGGVVFDGGSA